MPAAKQNSLLLFIIFSQFAGTSLWFAGNAVIDSLPGVSPGDYAILTSSVQAGFIAGTLMFSLFTIADRFTSTKVFFISSVFASLANLLIIFLGESLFPLLALRFVTGFFLAGIYPVGMKIAADLFPDKVGKALGWLVGALVLGTSLPHFIRYQAADINWKIVLFGTSALAIIGGLVILFFVPMDRKTKSSEPVHLLSAFQSFRLRDFRSAALGYFGHMWELYAFWAILPTLFSYFNSSSNSSLNIYLWSFIIIATGSLGCALGGIISQKWGSKKVAFYSLLVSGLCCLMAPFFFKVPPVLFVLLLLTWGFAVTADSPQFSALVAKSVADKNKGTALTIVTSLGFAITIVSIQIIKELFEKFGEQSLWLLCLGPLFGLIALKSPNRS